MKNKKNKKMTSKQCIKVSELRKNGYTDFESWLEKDCNIYVGRLGRIWIHEKTGTRMFHYLGSKWANPFKVNKECSLELSLEKYIDYIVYSGLIYDIKELKNKTLGCWCKSFDCHANILTEIVDGELLADFFQ